MTEAYVSLTAASPDELAVALAALRELPASELAGATCARALIGAGEDEEAGVLACVSTTLMPAELVELAREFIEEALVGSACDVELLLFGEDEWVAGGVPVPHPELLETAWWVESLTGAWPEVRMPDGSKPSAASVRSTTRALRSLGPVPGYESLTTIMPGDAPAAESGADTEDASCSTGSCSSCGPKQVAEFCGPVTDEPDEWTVVASASSTDLSPFTQEAIELSFLETVLREAGIETAWYPHRPGDMYTQPPMHSNALAQLLVQPWRADEARTILASAASAEPEGEWWAEDWDEDEDGAKPAGTPGAGETA